MLNVIFSQKIIATAVILLFNSVGDCFITSRVKFVFYSKNNSEAYRVSNLTAILDNPKFDDAKTTVFYFYGITNDKKTMEVVSLRDAYLSNDDYNFVLVTIRSFLYNFLFVEWIGESVGEALINLLDAGHSPSRLEIVGYSMGAQIGAVAAKYLKVNSSIYVLPRLVALEPAPISSELKMNSTDASFVVTIHTTTLFSDVSSTGSINFWVNGAETQPMCFGFLGIPNAVCSHGIVVLYWAEAVRAGNSSVFPSRKCNSFEEFNSTKCESNAPVAFMNTKTPKNLTGNYYLSTNEKSPFSKALIDP